MMLFINVLFTVTYHHLCVCESGVYARVLTFVCECEVNIGSFPQLLYA